MQTFKQFLTEAASVNYQRLKFNDLKKYLIGLRSKRKGFREIKVAPIPEFHPEQGDEETNTLQVGMLVGSMGMDMFFGVIEGWSTESVAYLVTYPSPYHDYALLCTFSELYNIDTPVRYEAFKKQDWDPFCRDLEKSTLNYPLLNQCIKEFSKFKFQLQPDIIQDSIESRKWLKFVLRSPYRVGLKPAWLAVRYSQAEVSIRYFGPSFNGMSMDNVEIFDVQSLKEAIQALQDYIKHNNLSSLINSDLSGDDIKGIDDI